MVRLRPACEQPATRFTLISIGGNYVVVHRSLFCGAVPKRSSLLGSFPGKAIFKLRVPHDTEDHDAGNHTRSFQSYHACSCAPESAAFCKQRCRSAQSRQALHDRNLVKLCTDYLESTKAEEILVVMISATFSDYALPQELQEGLWAQVIFDPASILKAESFVGAHGSIIDRIVKLDELEVRLSHWCSRSPSVGFA
jgi:hypothetical protein